MKQIPTLVSVIAVFCASGATLRLAGRDLSWTVPVAVIAQFFFALLSWWGLQRGDKHAMTYLWSFVAMFFLVILTAFVATGRLVSIAYDFPDAMLDVVGSAVIAAVLFLLVARRVAVNHEIPGWKVILLAEAALIFMCGVASLFTLFAGLKPAPQAATLALGAFWLSIGIFICAHAVGIERTFGPRWSKLNDFGSPMIAIIAFGWLTFTLCFMQPEGSRESLPAKFTAAAIAAAEGSR